MTGDKFTGIYSKYNEDDIPGTRVEPYDEKYVKRLLAENEELKTRCKEADRRAKPYGMDEWKAGEEARASYIERITALEKLSAEQDRKLREQELKHQAELERLRKALGMFLFHPTAFNESVENARRVLGVKDG